MKLRQIQIENFRSFDDQVIQLGDYVSFVGPNGGGKSTILMALNVFFRNNKDTVTDVVSLSEEDFHHRNTAKPVRITLTFEGLSPEARDDFKDYYRQGKLVISACAEWDLDRGRAEVKQHGSRQAMPQFAPFFKARGDGVKVAEQGKIYQKIREEFQDLPKTTVGTQMVAALQSYEAEHPEACELIDSNDQFYGVSRGANRLAKYVQWVYVPAVKEPSEEQEEGTQTALGQLLQRTVRAKVNFQGPLADLKAELQKKYQEVLADNQPLLNQLQQSLQSRLQEWATSGAKLAIDWLHDADKSVVVNEPSARVSIGEDEFIGEVARLGHGLQRAFLVSVLQELAVSDEENSPCLLLGFEEPELYLHPPQAQHVANVLEGLSEKQEQNSQILVTTHSPYFVSSKGFEDVRLVRKDLTRRFSTVSSTTYREIAGLLAAALSEKPAEPSCLVARIEQIMQPSQRELFFTRLAVLVEGPEDVAFISTHLHLTGRWDDFRRRGCHFVVCHGKTTMSRPLAIAIALGVPAFAVFDLDTDHQNVSQANANLRDNGCILTLASFSGTRPKGIDITDVATAPERDALSTETLWRDRSVAFCPRIGDAVRAEFGHDVWTEAERKAREKSGLTTDDVRGKNPMVVAGTLEELHSNSKVSALLTRTCEAILAAAPPTPGKLGG